MNQLTQQQQSICDAMSQFMGDNAIHTLIVALSMRPIGTSFAIVSWIMMQCTLQQHDTISIMTNTLMQSRALMKEAEAKSGDRSLVKKR